MILSSNCKMIWFKNLIQKMLVIRLNNIQIYLIKFLIIKYLINLILLKNFLRNISNYSKISFKNENKIYIIKLFNFIKFN